ncbi:MAG: sensor histidine kinase [Campylobacterota bacterium]|nr:sensor histidine kinase [Campylobacterota bacterium]
MIKRYIFLFFTVTAVTVTTLVANDILKLTSDNTYINNTHYNYCKIDKEFKYDHLSIKNDTNMTQIGKSNLGYNSEQFWCKFEIVNDTDSIRKYIFTNPRPGVDHIDVIAFKDNNTIEKFFLGDMVPLENRSFKSVFSNFELELKPNQSVVIVSKYQTVGNLEVSWNIQDVKSFLEYENLNFMLIFIFFGFVFALMIYKSFFYIYLKDKIYLVYSILLFSLIVSQASLQGTFHYFLHDFVDYKTITLSSWIFTHIFLVTMWIFTYVFFNITKQSKFHLPLKIIIYYNIVVTCAYCYAYIDISILQITPIVLLTALIESVLLLIFAIIMVVQKKPGSYFFFIGHFIYIVSVVYYILILNGNLEFSLFYRHITPLGLFAVIIFMSMALSKRFQKLKSEIDKNKEYVTMGKTISFVAHEWKQPISILASQVSSISAKIDHHPDEKISSLEKNIKGIDKSIVLLNNILDTVKRVFSIKQVSKDRFIFQDFIKELEDYFQSQFSNKKIKFRCNIESKLKIYSDRELLFEVVKNIIQNSVDAFNPSSSNNEIILNIEQTKSTISKIIIEDNAGGIKIDNIEDIFEPSISTKSSNMGIGLSIVKHIVQDKLQNSIKIKNIDNGTRVIIKTIKG